MGRYGAYILLIATCAGLFFWKLGGVPFIGYDEAVYSECAREMLASGDYVVPRMSGESFFDKPPLCYWMQDASMRVFGVSSLGARLPSAVIALLLVCWTAFLGGRLFGGKAGLYAGFALATSTLYAVTARMAIMDQAFSLTISLALGAFLLTYLKLIPRWGYVGFWAAMGAASLIKGPAGAVLALITVGAFLILRRDWRGIPRAMPVMGLLAFFAIALPWYILVHQHTSGAFTSEFFLQQNLARAMGKGFSHNYPVYTYVPLFAFGFFPWSIFFIKAWAAHVKLRPAGNDRTGQAALFAAVWTMSIIGVFTITKSKLPGYILPAFPGAALLVGLTWSRAIGFGKAAALKPYATASLLVAGLFSALLIIGPGFLKDPIPELPAATIPMGICLLLGALAAVLLLRSGRENGAFASLCAGMAGFLACTVALGLPIASRSMSDPIVKMAGIVRHEVPAGGALLCYSMPRSQPALEFYAGRVIPEVGKNEGSVAQSLPSKGSIYLVTEVPRGITDSNTPVWAKFAGDAWPLMLYRRDAD